MTASQDKILVVDDEPVVLEFLAEVLTREGFAVSVASDARGALEVLGREPQDLVLCDIRMPGMDGFEFLKAVCRRNPGTDVILMTGYASVDGAIDAMTQGAVDYLIKPLKPKEIVARIQACVERRHLEAQIHSLKSELRSRYDRHNIVADSPRMTALVAALNRIAAQDEPVLLTGEPGTGRHFLARAIHLASSRREGRMAELECDRSPPSRGLELIFGRTPSDGRRRPGQLERLRGGTLHLAEFDFLSSDVQEALGRCLDEKTWRPVGEHEDRPLETRLILSCSSAPAELVEQGRIAPGLRAVTDLVTLQVPALRDRREDVPGLVQAFTEEYAMEQGRMLSVPAESVDRLATYDFPGNVRQLHLTLCHAASLSADGVLGPDLVERALENVDGNPAGGTGRISEHLDEREYQLVLRAVQRYPRRLDEAARELGVSRTTLWRRMRKYDIRVPSSSSQQAGGSGGS